MRVGAIPREPLALQGLGSRAEQVAVVREMMAEVGLPTSALERFPHGFSGGQRQRIGLARALMLNPKMIVADEPVSALDVSIRAQVLNLMKRLQADHDLSYVVISHDLAVVKYLADQIGVMYLGKMVEVGSGEDIYQRAAHPYTAGLIKAIPIPDPLCPRAGDLCGRGTTTTAPIRPRPRRSVPLPVAHAGSGACRLRTEAGWGCCVGPTRPHHPSLTAHIRPCAPRNS
jgi:ABC-type oligopeptide transport system ATPase subunit